MIFGVIPAAGKSSRIGLPKLALPIGKRTILERAIEALQVASVTTVVVVVGKHVPQLITLVEKAGAHALLLDTDTAHMRQTVEAGLRWIESRFQPAATDDWLLLPADHPVLEADAIRLLLAGRRMNPARSIVAPTYLGKRGHPVLFAWSHVAEIRKFPEAQGIDAYLRAHNSEVLELAIDHPGILRDLDTWDDYEELRGRHPGD
jgi:CTP:molybdopterin cytidylyltransferase MocA